MLLNTLLLRFVLRGHYRSIKKWYWITWNRFFCKSDKSLQRFMNLIEIYSISDDDFLLRLRLAANDPYLSKIAQEYVIWIKFGEISIFRLNPSYDNVGDWLSAGYSLVSLEFPHAIQTGNAPNHAASMLSKEMQEEMSRHNSYLSDEKEALLKLLQLSKKPYGRTKFLWPLFRLNF